MKFTATSAAVTFLIALLAASANAPAATRGASYNTVYSDHYQIIEARNVFVKDRAHIVIRQPGENPAGNTANGKAAQRNPDEAFVLTGVVREGNGYRAYFENLDSGNVQRLSPGDALYKGKVGEIDLDAVAYDPAGGQRMWIDIGDDLTGKPSSALSAKAAEESSSAASPDIANINPNDPNLTIEQKMKLRRAQQMGQPLPGTPGAPGAAPANGNPTSQPSAATPTNGTPPPQPAPNAQPAPQQQQPIIVIPPEGFQPSGPQ